VLPTLLTLAAPNEMLSLMLSVGNNDKIRHGLASAVLSRCDPQ
jgi:hypothetical protein